MPFFNPAVFKNLIFMLFLAAGVLASGPAEGLDDGKGIGLIQADRLNMRSGPGLDQPVEKVLPRGTLVRVLARANGWLKVSHEGDVGFIVHRAQYVRYPLRSGKDGLSSEIEALREEAGKVREKIRAGQKEISAYSRQEKRIIDALDAVDQQMAEARRKIRDIGEEIAALDQEMANTRKRVEHLENSLAEEKAYARRRLVALHKMRRLGEMNLLASAESINTFLNRKAAMEKILEYDQRVVAGMLEKQVQLKEMLAALDAQTARKKKLESQYSQTLAQLKQKEAERKQLLSDIRRKKATRKTTLKYLKNAADRLAQTISDLQGQTAAPPDSPRLFSSYQGLLNMPVEGKIISDYGRYIEPRSGVANFRNGIEIQTVRGAPVRAVFAGETIYADWLKGYGNVIIIAHGNEYHTVYAHAEEIFLSQGDHVEAGDVIATVGDSGSLSATALYFEVRHGGDPVNPLKWIDNS